MRILKTIILAVIAVILVAIALANAQTVTLRLLPDAMAGFLGFTWTLTLPMFVVILLAVGIGLLIGFFWEFAREHKHRAAARSERRDRESLEKEMKRMKSQRTERGDDIIALLEDGSVPQKRVS